MVSAVVESTLGYHSFVTEILTMCSETWQWTVIGRQFDWGGRLPKSNGGVQRSAQRGRKPRRECKRRSRPNCETDMSSSNESWS